MLTHGDSYTRQFLLDSRGRLLQQVQPDGATTTNVVDAEGQVDVAVDALGRPTLYSYVYGAYNSNLGGGDGDLVQTTNADGTTETDRYDSTFHELTQSTNALGQASGDTDNTTMGDLLSSTDALGQTSTDVWANGLLTTTTDARGINNVNWFDGDRRLAVSFDGMGVPTFSQYDTSGNPSTTLDALLRPTQTTFNGDDELVKTVGPKKVSGPDLLDR